MRPKNIHTRILDLLTGEPGGLTLEALAAGLLADGGRPSTPDWLDTTLRGDPTRYALQDGRWRSAELVRKERIAARQQLRREGRRDEVPPVDPTHYVVLDLEATGTDPLQDRPVEVAAVRFEGGREVARFHSLVAPGRPMSEGAKRVTGLREEDLAEAPSLAATLLALRDFLGDTALVGHNLTRYDWPMLVASASEVGLPWPALPLVDTMELALILLPRLARHTLTALVRHFELPGSEGAHRAMADVLMTAAVFQRLCAEPAENAPMAGVIASLLPVGSWLPAAFLRLPDNPPSVSSAMKAMQPIVLPVRPGAQEEDVDLDALAAGLAARGEPRPAQAQMVREVGQALTAGDRLLIEAPTGTGKTRAYLAPALAIARSTGRRILVAPNSRLLQSQVLDELRALAPDAAVCRFQGSNNLVCRMHLARAARQASQDLAGTPLARRLALAQVLVSLIGRTEGVLRDLPTRWLDAGDEDREGSLLREELAIGPGCFEPEDRADAEPSDYGKAMMRNAVNAEIVVTNQIMLLRSLDTLAPLGDLVFDEAHNLEDAATLAWMTDCTRDKLNHLAGRMLSPDGRRGLIPDLKKADPELVALMQEWQLSLRGYAIALEQALAQYVRYRVPPRKREEALDEGSQQVVELLLASLHSREWEAVDKSIAPLSQLLDTIHATLAEAQRPQDAAVSSSLVALADGARACYDFLEEVRGLKKRQENVYTVSTGGPEGWSLCREPIRVAERLKAQVYDEARAVVWTSATLTIEHSFQFVAGRIGAAATDPREVVLPPAFDYPANALVVLTNHLPTPRGAALAREFPEHVAQELARFIRTFRGGLLGLFTARRRMQRVADLVSRDVAGDGYKVMAQGGDLESQIEAFRAEHESSLFGVASLWEGVSVEGPALSWVAISKLPFPPLTPLLTARSEELRRAGSAYPFLDYLVPLAALRFKQGFGRLNRTSSDRGAVLVLDRRLQYATFYRDAFLNSLPGPPSLHRARGEDFYERICDFMGLPFDPTQVRQLEGTSAERLLREHTLREPVLTPEGYRAYRPALMAVLRGLFGFQDFRPHQEVLVEAQLTGRDVLGILPTGAGKSLTFQLPALLRDGLTLVISPLVALMKDQVDVLRERVGARLANCLIGGQSSAEVQEILSDAEEGRLRLLYVSPERLSELRVLETLRRARLVQLVVDEAHCVSAWGQSFRPDFLDIRDRLADFPRVPVAALTATAPPAIREAIVSRLEMRNPLVEVATADRPNLYLEVIACSTDDDRRRTLLALVKGMAFERGMAGIVYVASVRKATELREFLRSQNVLAEVYTGQMRPLDKATVQEMFMNGDVEVIVATNAFGMGIDKRDVRFVIHYDLPDSPEMYYQEAGRAGRDGEPSYAILLNSERAVSSRQWLINRSVPSDQELDRLAIKVRLTPFFAGCHWVVPEELGLERNQDAKGLLYRLAQRGGWRREGAFTASARIKLHARVEDLRRYLAEAEPDERLREALQAVLTGPGIRGFAAIADVPLAKEAIARELDPLVLEAALLRHTSLRTFDYRANATGLVLRPDPAAPRTGLLQQSHAESLAQFQRLLDYTRAACRWAHLRRALGDTPPARCGRCDRCNPHLERPWDLADVVMLPATKHLLDVEGTVLDALCHFDGEIGEGSLIRGLVGIPHPKYGLPNNIKNSPYLACLAAAGEAAVHAAVRDLFTRGIATYIQKEGRGKSLQCIALTAHGAREYQVAPQSFQDVEDEPSDDEEA